MKIHLMNSAMMPAAGTYTQKIVEKEEFKREFLKYAKSGFESYIGYPETARILSEFLGQPVPVSRKETKLADGDIIFVARLVYRLQNPHEKAENRQKGIDDFIFSIVFYRE